MSPIVACCAIIRFSNDGVCIGAYINARYIIWSIEFILSNNVEAYLELTDTTHKVEQLLLIPPMRLVRFDLLTWQSGH